MLNPPIIESKLPAFQLPNNGNLTLKVPFVMNRTVGAADFTHLKLLVKTVSTGKQLFENPLTSISHDNNIAVFEIDRSDIAKFQANQFYKVQLAYSTNTDTSWLWSTVGVIKCTNEAIIAISDLNSDGINNSLLTYEGTYENNDSNEKVYNYYFTIYNEHNEEHETSGLLVHNANLDTDIKSSKDTWSPIKGLTPGKEYTIVYGVKTINGLDIKTDPAYKISDSFAVNPPEWCNTKLEAILHRDDGYIELKLVSSTNLTGKFILSRSSSKDNFQTWHNITKVEVAYHPTGLTIWNDFTIEQGVEYLYSIRLYNDNDIKSIHIVNNGYKILADFEDTFLFDGKRQLKIRFNPKVSSFKTTLLESKTDTIGGMYPFFFRNGNIAYKEFPISGLISLLGDDNEFFKSGLYSIQPCRCESLQITPALNPARTQLTAENFGDERAFKLEVLDWLNNGQPKLFRSPGEGNYIVRLMNSSLSPNDTLGRMLHTFNCTAYEIMECNFNNMKTQGYLNIPEEQTYLHRHVTTKLNHIDPVQSGILLDPQTHVITGQDGRTMYDIIITNAIPFAQHFQIQSGQIIQADINGEVRIPSASSITILNPIELQLITLDFNYHLTFTDGASDWDNWNNLSSVILGDTIKLDGIYSNYLYEVENEIVKTDLLKYNNSGEGYLKFNNDSNNPQYFIDYLAYLKNTYPEVGEVSYLRIFNRKSEGRDFNSDELSHVGYSISVKSHNADVQYVKLLDGSRIYRDLGVLSELKCGNGYSVDIVFLRKMVS